MIFNNTSSTSNLTGFPLGQGWGKLEWGKEPFWRVLWLNGWHGVFNDQRYHFVQFHPSCNNHRSRGHFACLQTCFRNYKPGVMDISEWQAFGLLGRCRFFSSRKWKVVLILKKISCILLCMKTVRAKPGWVILDLYSPDCFVAWASGRARPNVQPCFFSESRVSFVQYPWSKK